MHEQLPRRPEGEFPHIATHFFPKHLAAPKPPVVVQTRAKAKKASPNYKVARDIVASLVTMTLLYFDYVQFTNGSLQWANIAKLLPQATVEELPAPVVVQQPTRPPEQS